MDDDAGGGATRGGTRRYARAARLDAGYPQAVAPPRFGHRGVGGDDWTRRRDRACGGDGSGARAAFRQAICIEEGQEDMAELPLPLDLRRERRSGGGARRRAPATGRRGREEEKRGKCVHFTGKFLCFSEITFRSFRCANRGVRGNFSPARGLFAKPPHAGAVGRWICVRRLGSSTVAYCSLQQYATVPSAERAPFCAPLI